MEPVLRTSERADFLRCQQRWWWTWREGLVSSGRVPDALWFGTGVHIALAKWYCGPGAKRGPEPAETWSEWAVDEMRGMKIDRLLDDESEATFIEAKALGIIMLNGYRALYGRDEHKLIFKPEHTFRLRVPWPADQKLYPDQSMSDSTMFWYCGTFDSTWRHADTGQIWLDEHKTARTISTGHLSLDPQAGSYWAIAARALKDEGLIGPRERLAGIEYNFLRKGVPDDRPKDAQGYYTNKPTKAHYVRAWNDMLLWTFPGDVNGTIYTEAQLSKMKLEDLQALAELNPAVPVVGDRSKQQSAPLFVRHVVHRTSGERNAQLRRLQMEGLQHWAIRDGVLPIVKNPTRDCSFCPHQAMCELHEAGGNWQDFKSKAYHRADPYADHREGVENEAAK